jgi:hypothetical protein
LQESNASKKQKRLHSPKGFSPLLPEEALTTTGVHHSLERGWAKPAFHLARTRPTLLQLKPKYPTNATEQFSVQESHLLSILSLLSKKKTVPAYKFSVNNNKNDNAHNEQS